MEDPQLFDMSDKYGGNIIARLMLEEAIEQSDGKIKELVSQSGYKHIVVEMKVNGIPVSFFDLMKVLTKYNEWNLASKANELIFSRPTLKALYDVSHKLEEKIRILVEKELEELENNLK